MKDLTYIKVKEGKLWASDMPMLTSSFGDFHQSFIEVGNPEIIQKHLRLHFDGDGLHEVSGLQFQVMWHNTCIKLGKCKIADDDNSNNCAQLHGNRCQEAGRVAILSLKQEQPYRLERPVEGGTLGTEFGKQEQPSEEKEENIVSGIMLNGKVYPEETKHERLSRRLRNNAELLNNPHMIERVRLNLIDIAEQILAKD